MATRKSTQAAPAASVNDSPKSVLSPAQLTPQQLELVLETIACRALALERMLFDISERCGPDTSSSSLQASIDGALIVVNTIGAMADEANLATGPIVNGDWEQWTYGGPFAEAGKAVQS
ncbi:MAG: hypothetical protein EOO80_17255 [Oxalobacteraceae bacterium]|nr:MAG: hypothetical protein EOO80_17255 [Oxalobacteraceae bacterium]